MKLKIKFVSKMSSILRSTIYFRQYLNLNRSLAVAISPTKFPNITRKTILTPIVCSSSESVRSYFDAANVSISSVLNRVDNSVRRKFRVSEIDLNHILELLKHQCSVTPSEAVLILRICGSLLAEVLPEQRQKLVKELLEIFKKQGVKFDIIHYNALLAVYFENGNKFTPTEFLLELEKEGLQPDRITFQRLIAGCCKNGDIEGATKILEFMKEKELGINEQVFNALILGHCQRNDLESAQGIMGVMKEAGVPPSNETYATLMCGYAKSGNIDKIKELFDECENSKILLLNRDILKVVQELALSGHASHISEVLSKVQEGPDYNQEAVNASLPLIAAGQEEAAYAISKTMTKAPLRENPLENISVGGHYFVRQLVKSNRPMEKIKHYTNLFATEHSDPLLYNVAMKEAIHKGDIAFAKELFKFAEAQGVPVRPHYFWPLMKKQANDRNTEGIYQLLEMMIEDFKLLTLRETVRDAAVHDLVNCGESWQSIFDRCTALPIPSGTVAAALVINLLKRNRIKEAAEIVKAHRAYYQPYFIRPLLVKAYFGTKDLDSFMTIAHAMYLSVMRQEDYRGNSEVAADSEDDPLAVPDKTNMISKTVYDILNNLVKDKRNAEEVERFLKALLDHGLGISEACAQKITSWLRPILTAELANVIEQLASENLKPAAFSSAGASAQTTSSDRFDERVLSQILKLRLKDGKPVDVIRHQLFQMYCRSRDIDKALQMKQELEESGDSLTEGEFAILADAYIAVEDLENAQMIFDQLRNETPGFNFDYSKTMRFLTLLVQKDKLQEAEQLLQNSNIKRGEENLFVMKSTVKNLLNAVADKNDPDLVEKFLSILQSKQYIEVSSFILGSVIKAYLNRDDLAGAIEKFEHICNTYNFTPLKNELTKRLIKNEDTAALQRVTDLSTAIHGEVNSLIDLMECFLEVGRTQQARRILETPGLRLRQDRFRQISENMYTRGEEDALKNLIEVTRGIPDISRSVFYLNLLKLYADANDAEKAYSLLLRMQEQDEIPSDKFLVTLADLLRKNGREVPFQVPAVAKQIQEEPKVETKKQKSPIKVFQDCIAQNDLDKALQFVNTGNIPSTILSSLLPALMRKNRVSEAFSVIKTISDRGDYVNVQALKPLYKNLGEAVDYETLCELRRILPGEQGQDPFLLRSIFVACKEAGRISDLFKELDLELITADSERLEVTFPIGVLLRVLAEQPQYLAEVEALCERAKEKSLTVSEKCLWNIYTVLDIKSEERERLRNSLMQDEMNFFEPAIKLCEYREDFSLLDRIKDAVWSSSNGVNLERKKARIITAEIRLCMLKNQPDEALRRLESGLKDVDISQLRRSVLKNLERQAKASNLPFDFKIPTVSAEGEDENKQKVSTQ